MSRTKKFLRTGAKVWYRGYVSASKNSSISRFFSRRLSSVSVFSSFWSLLLRIRTRLENREVMVVRLGIGNGVEGFRVVRVCCWLLFRD